MKFDCIVGNPPYGLRTNYIHLNIMQKSLSVCRGRLVFIMPSKPITRKMEKWYDVFKNAVCTNIEVVGKEVFGGTDMDNTAIYYCNRNESPDNYCRKLDADLYCLMPDAARILIDGLSKKEQIHIYSHLHDRNPVSVERCIRQIKRDDIYYLNINRFFGSFGGNWISGKMRDVGILNREEEKEYVSKNHNAKNIIGCPSVEYGENLKRLMADGLVLRFGLWYTQNTRNILQEQLRYVPDIDYTHITTDEELLYECGFTKEETNKVMDYLKNFDFSQSRNDLIRDFRK